MFDLSRFAFFIGGKSPAIVFDDADFDVTSKRLIWGKALNAGQTCIAPDYILVSKKSESKLIDALKKAISELYPIISDTESTSTEEQNNEANLDYCKIINSTQFDRLEDLLEKTQGEIITLEKTSLSNIKKSSSDLKMPLTLVRNVNEDDILMKDEIFGPILPIITYDSETEKFSDVLNSVSESEPLAIYVFTQTSSNFELGKFMLCPFFQYADFFDFFWNDVIYLYSKTTNKIWTNPSKRSFSSIHHSRFTFRRHRSIS